MSARHLLRVVWMILVAAASIACDPAAGREATISIRLSAARADGASPARFVTSTGWDVTLEEAAIHLGPVYLFENAPPAATNEGLRQLTRWLIPAAHAHAGDQHFFGGAVLAEHVEPATFDLLSSSAVDLGLVPATVARARSFSVLFLAPEDEDGPTRGGLCRARGTATKDGVTIPFEGVLDLPALASQRRVDGLPLEADLDDGGVFTLEVHPDRWFDAAEFASLPPADGSAPRQITSDTQAYAAWRIGVRAHGSFVGRWSRE